MLGISKRKIHFLFLGGEFGESALSGKLNPSKEGKHRMWRGGKFSILGWEEESGTSHLHIHSFVYSFHQLIRAVLALYLRWIQPRGASLGSLRSRVLSTDHNSKVCGKRWCGPLSVKVTLSRCAHGSTEMWWHLSFQKGESDFSESHFQNFYFGNLAQGK